MGRSPSKGHKSNLHPYRDFYDLAVNGKPDLSLVGKVDDNLKEIEHRRHLKQAIYGPYANLVPNGS